MNSKVLRVACAAMIAGACASGRTTGGVLAPELAPAGVRSVKILLMPVPDGVERKEGVAAGSGNAMTIALRDSLVADGGLPRISQAKTLEDALEEAKRLGWRYVLKCTFTEWEDNITAWSGRPDVAALSAELYDAQTGTLVATATHRAQSSTMTWSANSPDELVPRVTSAVLAKIFARTPSAGAP
ncbi:MAG: DUF4823 domain-containing protein [Gemmatimonadaceae bacterium]|jgi:hypothetical protein|nr:DUF4823 domain-containing protein [Gemmatimonadaceae bacterium]